MYLKYIPYTIHLLKKGSKNLRGTSIFDSNAGCGGDGGGGDGSGDLDETQNFVLSICKSLVKNHLKFHHHKFVKKFKFLHAFPNSFFFFSPLHRSRKTERGEVK